MTTSKGSRGAVLIEGLLVTGLSFLAVFLLLEIYRLSLFHLSIQHSVFIYTRERAFGRTTLQAERTSKRFLDEFWGADFRYPLYFEEKRQKRGVRVSLHVRYPQFLRFWYEGGSHKQKYSKHHLETTKTCHFPL